MRVRMQMTLGHLPRKVVLLVADLFSALADINSAARVCRRLYAILNQFLYKRAWLDGLSLLTWAVNRNRPQTITHVARIGKRLSTLPDLGSKALALAARRGRTDVAVQLLSYQWAEPNKPQKLNVASASQYRTPIMWAASMGHADIARMLLRDKRVTRIDYKDSMGRNVMWYAASGGHEEVTQLLLHSDGLDIDMSDRAGWTPLAKAAGHGHVNIVRLLLSTGRVSVNAKHDMLVLPLLEAAKHGHTGVMIALLDTSHVHVDARDALGRTALWWACQAGHESAAKILLGTGKAGLDCRDRDGHTLLCLAAAQDKTSRIFEILLVYCRAIADEADGDGRTPLSHAAAADGSVRVRALLLTGNVNVNSQDRFGWTPLIWAASKNSPSAITALLDMGHARVDVQDSKGETALIVAAKNGHLQCIELLTYLGMADMNLQDELGKTALHWAASQAYPESVALLMSSPKTNPNILDYYGRTPLMICVQTTAASCLSATDMVLQELLRSERTELEVRDHEGRTALSHSTSRTKTFMLLARGGNVFTEDNEGHTPMWWTKKHGLPSLFRLMREYIPERERQDIVSEELWNDPMI